MATNFVKRRSRWTSSEKNSAYSVNIRKRALGATLDANGNLSIYRPASGGGLGLHIEQEGTAACLQLTGGGIQPAVQTLDATAGALAAQTVTPYGVTLVKTASTHTVAGTLADLTAADVGRTKTFITDGTLGSGAITFTGNFGAGTTTLTLSVVNGVGVLMWSGAEWMDVAKSASGVAYS